MADPSTEANTIYGELVPDNLFPSVTANPADADFDLPDQVGNALYTDVTKIALSEITTEEVEGAGAFDTIMRSLKAHLKEEFDAGRITGAEYSKAYIELTTAALTTGLSFVLQSQAALYQNQLVQQQARTAEVQRVMAGVELARSKQGLVNAQVNATIAKANFALIKMQIANADVAYTQAEKGVELAVAQISQIQKETEIANYRLTDMMPEEKRRLTYEVDNVMVAAVAKTEYETEYILPQQLSNLVKDGAIKDYQVQNIMPEQRTLLTRQVEVQQAQFSDTLTDGATAVTGAIGKQKALYDEQITSYQKDARLKASKFWVDGWITQKSLDEGLTAPDQFTNVNVNEVLAAMKLDLNLL